MSRTRHRFAQVAVCLLFAAALLVSVSNAWASTITYDIVNHPTLQAYLGGSGDVQVSGSLTIKLHQPGNRPTGRDHGHVYNHSPHPPTPTTYTETYSGDNSAWVSICNRNVSSLLSLATTYR